MKLVTAGRPDVTAVERVFREAYGQAVATLIRIFGDITLAEDAVQDAFVAASDRWRRDGIPPNPAGWIVTTARNRAIDDLRRSARGRDHPRGRSIPRPVVCFSPRGGHEVHA